MLNNSSIRFAQGAEVLITLLTLKEALRVGEVLSVGLDIEGFQNVRNLTVHSHL